MEESLCGRDHDENGQLKVEVFPNIQVNPPPPLPVYLYND